MVTADAGAAFGPKIRADSLVVASSCGHQMFIGELPRVGQAIRQFVARERSNQGMKPTGDKR